MNPRSLLAPALLCTLLVPTGASAAPEDGGVDPIVIDVNPPGAMSPAPADPAEAVVMTPPEVAGFSNEVVEPEEAYDPYPYEDAYDDPYVDDYEPKRTTLELDSGYIGLGIAPGLTLHHKGFHPNTRFELEFGGTLEHRYRDLALSFGVVTHLTPYYERKSPGYGADVTLTALLGPVYLRTGLGALGGLPRSHRLHDTAAAIGGVVGAGLTFGRVPMIRVGVDYDLRITTRREPIHTFLLALRFACCRQE